MEKGATEDEMVGWHHGLYGHGFEWTPGVGIKKAVCVELMLLNCGAGEDS